MRRLAVFPASSLREYWRKGEIKPRYYNPLNVFDEVHFITLVDRDQELNAAELEQIREIVGTARIFVHAVGRLSWGRALNYPFIRAVVLRTLKRIQPVCVRTYSQYFEGQLAASCCRRLNIPLIASLHTATEAEIEQEHFYRADGMPERMRRTVEHAVKRRMEKNVVHAARVVLPVSHYIADSVMKAASGSAQRPTLKVIYNRVYTEQYSRARFEPNAIPRILTVGSLVRRKYQDPIVAAIAGLNVRLQIIGQGPRRGELQDMAHRLGVAPQVEFIDRVPNTEIHRHYGSCDIVAMSTHYEGFCIPVLEGMAAGKPVVVSDTPPLPEVLGGTGIVVDKTPEGFRRAFVDLLARPDLRASLGQRARQRAEQLDGALMEMEEAGVYRQVWLAC